jgi:hypothetical protein
MQDGSLDSDGGRDQIVHAHAASQQGQCPELDQNSNSSNYVELQPPDPGIGGLFHQIRSSL